MSSVVRVFEFDQPPGVRPQPGAFRASFGGSFGLEELRVTIDKDGIAEFLGVNPANGDLLQASGVTIDVDGRFEFASGEETWRGQFDELRVTGGASDGLSVFGGVRQVSSPGSGTYLSGPVVGSSNGRLRFLADSLENIILVQSGLGGNDYAYGTYGTDGSFELIDTAGRVYAGIFDQERADVRGGVSDGLNSYSFTLDSGAANPGERLANISTRGQVGTSDSLVIAGFVVEGDTGARVLVRGVGPGLAGFELDGLASGVEILLRKEGDPVGFNRGWRSDPIPAGIEDVFSRVGAFPLTSDTGDSALVADLDAGIYTVEMGNPDGTGGLALIEIYDVDQVGGFRLLNLSTRGHAGSEANALIAGFVLGESVPRRLLIRGIGPGLNAFDVDGAIANPKITLMGSVGLLAANDDWQDGTDAALIASLGRAVGAFDLVDGSADSAITRYLGAGEYTVLVEPAEESGGVALIEIYIIPDLD